MFKRGGEEHAATNEAEHQCLVERKDHAPTDTCRFVFSNDHAGIRLGNFQRCSIIITASQILPEWELRWYRGDDQNISLINSIISISKMLLIHHKSLK